MRSIRQMNHNFMNTMMSDPFGMFRGLEAITGPSPLAVGGMNNTMMPFNFPQINTNRLLGGMGGDNNYHHHPHGGNVTYSSSSYVSMTSGGPDGRPQIYKETSTSNYGPGGIRQTKKTVQDSRTGVSKMAIGQHIGERAHVIERQKNAYTGEEEETVDLINVDETEAEEFDREFKRRSTGHGQHSNAINQRYAQLALPAPPLPLPPQQQQQQQSIQPQIQPIQVHQQQPQQLQIQPTNSM